MAFNFSGSRKLEHCTFNIVARTLIHYKSIHALLYRTELYISLAHRPPHPNHCHPSHPTTHISQFKQYLENAPHFSLL